MKFFIYQVIINGLPTTFFKSHCGLRQRCVLSPIPFLLVMDAFIRKIMDFRERGLIMSIKMTRHISIIHLNFIDDLVFGGESTITEWSQFHHILSSFVFSSGLIKNSHKYEVIYAQVTRGEIDQIYGLFGISSRSVDSGFHYLGFQIKLNEYKIIDSSWIIKKMISN